MSWVKNIDEAVTALQKEIDVLKKKADSEMPSPMKIKTLPRSESVKYISASNWKVKNYWGGYQREPETIEQVEKIKQEALELLEKDLALAEEIHNQNVPAIENNKLIHDKVTLIMRNTLSIPDNYSTWEYKTSRSSKKTETRHKAGYLGDLERNIPICDGYDSFVRSVSNYKSVFDKIANDFIQKIRKEEAERAKKEKESKSVMAKAVLLVKYGLSEDCGWDDILDKMRNGCKYFNLALAMESTRHNWSEGYYRVEEALNSFKIETEDDQKIYNEISGLCDADGFIDGRVFRDCHYNYSKLYAMADSGIVDDYETIRNYYSEY